MTKTRDRIGAAALLFVCVLTWVRSAQFPFEAQVFPRIVIALLVALSVAMFVRTFRRREADESPSTFFVNGQRFFLAIAAILAYIFLVSQVGYFTTTLLFIPALAFVLGYRNLTTLAVASTGFCLFVFAVFVLLFERPLPSEWLLEVL